MVGVGGHCGVLGRLLQGRRLVGGRLVPRRREGLSLRWTLCRWLFGEEVEVGKFGLGIVGAGFFLGLRGRCSHAPHRLFTIYGDLVPMQMTHVTIRPNGRIFNSDLCRERSSNIQFTSSVYKSKFHLTLNINFF